MVATAVKPKTKEITLKPVAVVGAAEKWKTEAGVIVYSFLQDFTTGKTGRLGRTIVSNRVLSQRYARSCTPSTSLPQISLRKTRNSVEHLFLKTKAPHFYDVGLKRTGGGN